MFVCLIVDSCGRCQQAVVVLVGDVWKQGLMISCVGS